MSNQSRIELEATLKSLKKQFPDRGTFAAAMAFLDIHLQLARVAKKSAPALAIEQFKLAESCQGCIGTYATGSGEGLASMSALYDIMAERAEFEEALANARQRTSDKIRHLQTALDIWKGILRDPNLGELLPKKDIKPLEKQLNAWKSVSKRG